MKLWPFISVLVGLVLAGILHLMVREPWRASLSQAGGELPRPPIDQAAAPVPPRFAGPLPSRVEGFVQELENGPPRSYVRSRLLEGDREMGAQFLAALRQAAASARKLDELWLTYGKVLGLGHRTLGYFDAMPQDDMGYSRRFEDEGVPCTWLREWLNEPHVEAPFLRELFWRKLVRCPGAETEALFAREDAPLESALQHHSAFVRPRFTPALERAVRLVLAEDRQDLFPQAEQYVAASQEAVARELREALWRQASDKVRTEWEQEAARQDRARRAKEQLPLKCPPVPSRPEGISDLMLSQCLGRWATSNWAATARFALTASRSPELQESEPERLATLRNFASLAAMKDWAVEQGLLPQAAPDPATERERFFLSALMEAARRAFRIGIVEGSFPRTHDELLVTLAWTARPELSGVVFEQLSPEHPPPEWHEERMGEEYTLRAYADGRRYSVKALNPYSTQDIGAVIGLLNHVLEARGSIRRFAVLDTDDVAVTVVLGPEAALREAHSRGLWRLGNGQEVIVQVEQHLWKGLRKLKREVPY